jgi:hypothetical protein
MSCQDIETALNGPEMFYCERHRCKLSIRACKKHREGAWTEGDCTDCPQIAPFKKKKHRLSEWWSKPRPFEDTHPKIVNTTGICSTPNCGKPHYSGGLCKNCYAKQFYYKHHPGSGPRIVTVGCKVPGCTAKHKAKGFCAHHLAVARWQEKKAKKETAPVKNKPLCKTEGCGQVARQHEMCEKCYNRWYWLNVTKERRSKKRSKV